MHFPELEIYKGKYNKLARSVDLFDDYLYTLLSSPKERDISPPLVAKKLGVEEATALVLLMFADEVGLIKPEYYVYCPNTEDFLGSYPSLDKLPEAISCPFEEGEKEHRRNEYFTELTFRFSEKAKDKLMASAA